MAENLGITRSPRARCETSTPSARSAKPARQASVTLPRQTKSSAAIEIHTVRGVLEALRHAAHIGLLPTRMITLALDRGDSTDPVDTIGRFLKLYKDAARSRGWPTAHIWAREYGTRTGEHVHILLHVPACSGNWLKRRMPRWLKRSGLTRRKGVSKVTQIAGRPTGSATSSSTPELYRTNLRQVVRYILKHCSSRAAEVFGIARRGPVAIKGKRVGVSVNLNVAARLRCQDCGPPRIL